MKKTHKNASSLHAHNTLDSHYFDIVIPFNMCLALYNYSVFAKQKKLKSQGFVQGNMPKTYIEANYFRSISKSITAVLHSHYIYDYILDFLHKEKLPLCFDINIKETSIDFDKKSAHITIQVPHITNSITPAWKNQKVRFPQRKKYKDLDRQAEIFVQNEISLKSSCKDNDNINIKNGDWVLCSVSLLNFWTHEPILPLSQKLWFYMSGEDADMLCISKFIGKAVGDTFILDNNFFLEMLTHQSDVPYALEMKILHNVSSMYFDIDRFKKYFNLKTQDTVYSKMIEVFSFRKDITQRRQIVQMILNAMKRYHVCTIPHYTVNQEAKNVLKEVSHSSDYLMYHSQKNFKEQVHKLAIKNVYEKTLVDKFASSNKVNVSLEDISMYCNFLQRSRLRDFIYFDIPFSVYESACRPVYHKVFEICVMREKTINLIVSLLSQNKKL